MPPVASVSIVMPAHNEESFLAEAAREVSAGLRGRGLAFEIIVVENGSRDATAALAQQLTSEMAELRWFSIPHADYGRALRTGFLAAHNDVVANFDVDYYDLDFLDQALEVMGADDAPMIVVGSKRGAGARDTRPFPRRLVTATFSWVLRHGFGLHVSDTHGIKALRREPLVGLVTEARFGTDLFDTELVLRAERRGLRTAEIPVVVEERRPSRTPIAGRVARSLVGLVRLRLALWRDRA